jgi:hypothetical protein
MRKPTPTPDRSLLTTELADFYRCDGSEGVRYYPATQSRKGVAIDYNNGQLPPTVKGFAVYDTTVSMDYAVALYGSLEEAHAHQAQPTPAVPETIFESKRIPASDETPVDEMPVSYKEIDKPADED